MFFAKQISSEYLFPASRPRTWPPALNFYLPVPALNLYFASLAPNLFLWELAPNLFLPALALLCLSVLRFTVKVCYSYSAYLHKLSVYVLVS